MISSVGFYVINYYDPAFSNFAQADRGVFSFNFSNNKSSIWWIFFKKSPILINVRFSERMSVFIFWGGRMFKSPFLRRINYLYLYFLKKKSKKMVRSLLSNSYFSISNYPYRTIHIELSISTCVNRYITYISILSKTESPVDSPAQVSHDCTKTKPWQKMKRILNSLLFETGRSFQMKVVDLGCPLFFSPLFPGRCQELSYFLHADRNAYFIQHIKYYILIDTRGVYRVRVHSSPKIRRESRR